MTKMKNDTMKSPCGCSGAEGAVVCLCGSACPCGPDCACDGTCVCVSNLGVGSCHCESAK